MASGIVDDTMLYASIPRGSEGELSQLPDSRRSGGGARGTTGGRRPGEYTIADQPSSTRSCWDDDLCGAAVPNFGKQIVESDSLKNYEIGAKMTLLAGRMQLNASAYYQVDESAGAPGH